MQLPFRIGAMSLLNFSLSALASCAWVGGRATATSMTRLLERPDCLGEEASVCAGISSILSGLQIPHGLYPPASTA